MKLQIAQSNIPATYYYLFVIICVRCAEILLKGITKQSLNELEENTIPHETPLLLAAQHGNANVSFLNILNKNLMSCKIRYIISSVVKLTCVLKFYTIP